MAKNTEVTYNPQLGYLQTVFHHDFDFLVRALDCAVTDTAVRFRVQTYRGDTAAVVLECAGPAVSHVRMLPPGADGGFDNSVFRLPPAAGFQVEDTGDFVSVRTERMEVRVRKYPWEISWYLDGALKTKEQVFDSNVDNMCKNLPAGFTYGPGKKVSAAHETMYLWSDEEFYGFGEKFTDFGKRGQAIHVWQSDALSTNTEASYKNHPFFLSSRGYAVLLNTYTRSRFDMGSCSNVAWNMEAEDPCLDYYLFLGRDYKDLLRTYTGLAGGIPMIPRWAFGTWMSKCSYRSSEEIMGVVTKAMERGVKLDVIHIDGWQVKEDTGAWDWDLARFPDPRELIGWLKARGIRLCLWIWPYIPEDSQYYTLAAENGWLVKDRDGGVCLFHATATSTEKVACFDFTNPTFRAWYVPRVKAVLELGVGAVKTDFSECVPERAVFFDGSDGVQGHNKLPFLYAKTIYDIMAEVKAETGERPMLWGRSGFAGSHTIPGAWAGDSSSALNNHACILRGGLSAAMSGIPFWAFDMGGFYKTDHEGNECPPTDEEYIRSCQFGFLNGLSRCHGKTPREPWNFGPEAEKIFNEFNALRHRLLPYLYSAAWEASNNSVPMLRPVVMEYPDDRNARAVELQYFLGGALLVAPVFDQDTMEVYLPQGEWADWFTGEIVAGGRWITVEKRMDRIPVFLRENRVVPCLTAIPDDIDCAWRDLNAVLFLNGKMEDAVLDDDGSHLFRARLEDGKLTVETDLPVNSLTVYAKARIDAAVLNGKAAAVEPQEKTVFHIS